MTKQNDKTIVVTGAGGGFGRAIVEKLAGGGVSLALGDLDPDALRDAEALAVKAGADVLAQPVDVTDETSVAEFFGAVGQRFGSADALLNLPGLSLAAKIAETSVEGYDRLMDVNVKGAFLAAKHFIPLADPGRGGQIVLISSMAAGRANPNAPLYCAAKAAVSMMGEGLALQMKERNVRVTTLKPGPVDTQGFWGDRPVPREKFMRPADVADVLAFVLSRPSHIVMHEVAFESFDFYKK